MPHPADIRVQMSGAGAVGRLPIYEACPIQPLGRLLLSRHGGPLTYDRERIDRRLAEPACERDEMPFSVRVEV